ncbi:MAG TPA: hypothetical protein VES97_00020 [Solirubrobacteraceae bacterium]|nr:hypothetical protein [Solirubrobacteraceae bacterium]
MRKFALHITLGISALGISATAVATTATPRPGPWYGETEPRGGKDDSAEFVVKDNRLVPQKIFLGWSAIIAPTSFKCNEALIQLTTKRLTITHGHFSYHGTAVDTAGNKSTGISGKLTWSGTFTSPTTVRGAVRFQTALTPVWHRESYRFSLEPKPCDTGILPWSGKAGRTLQ